MKCPKCDHNMVCQEPKDTQTTLNNKFIPVWVKVKICYNCGYCEDK